MSKSMINESDLRLASPKRGKFSNKYENGRLLIIGGSSFYYGAPVLALDSAYQSLAALRIGAGFAKAFVPAKILQTARSLSPNTIIDELGTDRIIFNERIKEEIEKTDVLLIGMGLGPNCAAPARRIIEDALKQSKRIIVDADAIAVIGDIKVRKQGSVLMTPHEGDFHRFTGQKLQSNDLAARVQAASFAAKNHNIIVVLKGHHTIVTDGRQTRINEAKEAALATMGTGDVLSGMIGGYAAACNDLFASAVAGVYLHSKIGDTLYKEMGNHIIATDVIEKISEMIKKYDKK